MRLFSTMSGPQSRPGRFLPGWGWTILLLVLPAVLAGCHRGQPPLADTKPPEVFYTLPVSMTVTDYENYSGQTAAINSIDIRARVSGYLEEVRFQEGMNVQKGDVLFVIDPRPYKDALDQAQADSNQAEANLGVAQTSLKLAQSTLDIDLKAGKAITELQLSQDRAAVDTNQAQVKAAQATIKVKAAAAQTAQRNLDWTQVTSPVTGRIGKRNEDPGNLVMADMTVLTNIVQLDPIYVYFAVDEHTMLRFRRLLQERKVQSVTEGAKVPVWLGLADEEGYPHEGTIDFVDNRVDPNTGTLNVRGVFPNANAFLSPGLFARVHVQIGTPHQAILIPERALGSDQDQKFAYLVNDKGMIEKQNVTVGALYGKLRVVEGLTPGQKVVVEGLQRIRPGIPVDAKPYQPSKEDEAPAPGAPPLGPSVTPGKAAPTTPTARAAATGKTSTAREPAPLPAATAPVVPKVPTSKRLPPRGQPEQSP